jgi:homoserine dehydrogenase
VSPAARVRVAFLGFGAVNQALHALLERRRDALARDHGIACTVTGVASRRIGWRANAAGLDPAHPHGASCATVGEWLAASRADVVFEAIALDPHSGQPALDYLRAALAHGAHAISANKGPVVHGYRELAALAAERGRAYRFEAAVMDGAPVFSLVRDCLPLAGLRAVRGVFTSTATVVLEAVEEGRTIDEGVARAQALGIAEADPSYDLEGWDASVKATVLANVLMNADLRPADVRREGLGVEAMRRAQAELAPGQTLKQMVEVTRDGNDITARVFIVPLPEDDMLGHLSGMETGVQLRTDTMGELTLIEGEGGPGQTALGVLADLVAIARERE